MPYPTVLPLSNAQSHWYNWLLNINNFLYQYNQVTGMAIPMPAEVTFEQIAIDQFQALAVTTLEGGQSTELQAGQSTELQTGSETQTTSNATTTDTSTQTTTHGETVNTTDGDQSEYIGYDPTVSPLTGAGDYTSAWPTVGLQSQPFPY